MNKKQIQKHYDIKKLNIEELKTILRTYEKLGYKFTLKQTIDELKDTLQTLVRCETLTYRELQKALKYYKEKGVITYLRRNREYLKVALFKIECRFSVK
jgi:hypothetical protein